MRVIATMAIGDRSWGDMALNLAISIKIDNPDQKIALIYDDSAVSGLEDTLFKYVDFGHRIHRVGPAIEQSMLEKVYLYHTLSKICPQATEVVYLNASVLILPGNEVDAFFDRNKEHDYFFYKNGEYDYQKKKSLRRDGSYWCNPEALKRDLEKRGVRLKHNMPQVVSAFLYFKINASAELFFNGAQILYSEDVPFIANNGIKCADFCFNVSAAMMGSPSTRYYRPIFIQQYSEKRDDVYVWHRYRGICLEKGTHYDARVVSMYNSVSRYLRDLCGVKPTFVFKRIRVAVPDNRPIAGFWHIMAINHYQEIVTEQLAWLLEYGLYDRAESVHVFCIGSKKNCDWVKKALSGHKKFIVFGTSVNDLEYEFPTLVRLQEFAKSRKAFCFYIHSKGVTYPDSPKRHQGNYYRMFLMHYVVKKWIACVKMLQDGHTCAGPGWIPAGAFPQHYRGNFWWANTDYISTLPDIRSLDTGNRFNAEFWIGMGDADPGVLTQSIIDYPNAEELYESEVAQ